MADWDQLREVGHEVSPPPFESLVRTAGKRDRRARIITATAGLALLAAIGVGLGVANDPDDADLQPAEDPSPSTVTPTEETVLPDGVAALPAPDPGEDVATLDAGRYRVTLSDTLSFDVDVPRDTYAHNEGLYLATGVVVLKTEVAGQAYGMPRDPCIDYATDPVGPTTADLVEAIRNEPMYQVSRPRPVELGGADGTYLEIRIPSDPDSSQCADGVILPANPDTDLAFEPGYRSRWWILDVDGERIAVQQNCVCSADDFDRAAAMPRSITFPPTT